MAERAQILGKVHEYCKRSEYGECLLAQNWNESFFFFLLNTMPQKNKLNSLVFKRGKKSLGNFLKNILRSLRNRFRHT